MEARPPVCKDANTLFENASPLYEVPGARFLKINISETTCVPVPLKAVLGNLIAPIKSAFCIKKRRTELLVASKVSRLVITATMPPGRVLSKLLAMK